MTSAAVLGAVFAALFAAHHVGDHIFQTDRQAGGKAASKRWLGPMLGHLAGYHLCVLAALAGLAAVGVPLSWPHVAAAVAWSAVTHGFIDRRWPVRWLMRRTGSAGLAEQTTPVCGMYVGDQALHVAALFVAALVVAAGVS